jgi:hypothetical protein
MLLLYSYLATKVAKYTGISLHSKMASQSNSEPSVTKCFTMHGFEAIGSIVGIRKINDNDKVLVVEWTLQENSILEDRVSRFLDIDPEYIDLVDDTDRYIEIPTTDSIYDTIRAELRNIDELLMFTNIHFTCTINIINLRFYTGHVCKVVHDGILVSSICPNHTIPTANKPDPSDSDKSSVSTDSSVCSDSIDPSNLNYIRRHYECIDSAEISNYFKRKTEVL